MSEETPSQLSADGGGSADPDELLGEPDSAMRRQLREAVTAARSGAAGVSDAELGERLAQIPGYAEAEAAVAREDDSDLPE